MKYNDLQEILKVKKILVKDLCEAIGYTRRGLQTSIDNETIELRKLKLLCDTLRITPAQFFDTGGYGVTISTGHVQAGNGNKIIIENKDREIEYLKKRLEDKDELITMLRDKIDMIQGAPLMAASSKPEYKTTKK
jgi:DNA-binding Xre family transcriptional regulator